MSLTTVSPGLLGANSQYTGFKNRIINGAMVINQRGTQSASPLNGYTLDRWLFSRSGSGTSTVSQTATANYGGRYSLTVVSAHAGGEVFGVEQRIESFNCSDLAGSTVTIQFYASATTSAGALGTFSVAASYATATDNFSSATSISSTTFVPTSTPTLFTAQFAIPSAATTGLKIQFSGGQISATGTVTFNLGGVQLEKGSTATSFDYRPYGTELALCQRYYVEMNPRGTLVGLSDSAAIPVVFPVPMRTSPTSSLPYTDATFTSNGAPGAGTWNMQSVGVAATAKTGTLSVGAAALSEKGMSVSIFGAQFARTTNYTDVGPGFPNMKFSAEL